MGFIKEFTDFAVKGNALDLAVGVILGAAFGKVVNSIVTDIFMPPLGWAIGGVNFNELKWVIKPAVAAADGVAAQSAVAINYGAFLDTVIQFGIVAFSVFVAIRFLNKLTTLRSLSEIKKLSELAKGATNRVAGAARQGEKKSDE
ncbi:MAG: large conductance mechanosensitive channel protein MscL [Planctomycetota bacterium]